MITQLKSVIFVVTGLLVGTIPLFGFYALVQWLPASVPFATAEQCNHALIELQYYNHSYHGEDCAELKGGGWCILYDADNDPYGGRLCLYDTTAK